MPRAKLYVQIFKSKRERTIITVRSVLKILRKSLRRDTNKPEVDAGS